MICDACGYNIPFHSLHCRNITIIRACPAHQPQGTKYHSSNDDARPPVICPTDGCNAQAANFTKES